MQNTKRTDSNLKVVFQTAAAAVATLVVGNAYAGLDAGANVYDRLAALKKQG